MIGESHLEERLTVLPEYIIVVSIFFSIIPTSPQDTIVISMFFSIVPI